MELNINDQSQHVEVWLSSAEKNDIKIQETVHSICEQYKNSKYMVIVYKSGTGDLFEGTKSLLIQNMKN